MTTDAKLPVVAWRIRYRSDPRMIGSYPWAYVERKPRSESPAYEVEALITESDALAYADAKVREALEALRDIANILGCG